MNLTDFATVVLTDRGANALNYENERLNITFAPMHKRSGIIMKTDYKEGDRYANILRCLLDTFSDCFEDGKHLPFEFILLLPNKNTTLFIMRAGWVTSIR